MTIILDNISKAYGAKNVLHNFRLEIEWDKCIAIVGPKGAGKTTVLKIFMGTEKPDSGSVARMGDYKYPTLHTAYVPQEGSLVLKKNAIWNVKKVSRHCNKKRAMEELKKFLPEEKMTLPSEELSPAERAFVELVKAFFTPADFFVLDEPFVGMNDEEKAKALAYVLEIRGTRPLLISQETEEGLPVDKVIHLS